MLLFDYFLPLQHLFLRTWHLNFPLPPPIFQHPFLSLFLCLLKNFPKVLSFILLAFLFELCFLLDLKLSDFLGSCRSHGCWFTSFLYFRLSLDDLLLQRLEQLERWVVISQLDLVSFKVLMIYLLNPDLQLLKHLINIDHLLHRDHLALHSSSASNLQLLSKTCEITCVLQCFEGSCVLLLTLSQIVQILFKF